MKTAEEIVKQLTLAQSGEERIALLKEFKALSDQEQQSVETQLTALLQQADLPEVIYPWIPEFLAVIGTESAFKTLIEHLPVEKSSLVRGWIGRFLIMYGGREEHVLAVIQQIDRELTLSGRRAFLSKLTIPEDMAVTKKLMLPKLIALLDDPDYDIRRRAAHGLGRVRDDAAIEALVNRLLIEDISPDQSPSPENSLLVSRQIIDALIDCKATKAIPGLLKILQDQTRQPQLHIYVLQAIGQLADPEEEVIQTTLETICSTNRLVAFTATDTLQTLLPSAVAARHLAQYGLQQQDAEKLPRIALGLRLIGGSEAINFLQQPRQNSDEENRAQILLEQIGGRQALNVLVDRRIKALNQAQGRVKEFDEQALKIFTETINEAKRGFVISLWMSSTIFVVGVLLLGMSAYVLFLTDPTRLQMFFGAGSGIAGMGSILAMFYRGPLERIERAVSNLVQTEIAFLGYIRQVTQITAMFEREYLDNENFGIPQLADLLAYTENTVKETMPLVNLYTARSANAVDAITTHRDNPPIAESDDYDEK